MWSFTRSAQRYAWRELARRAGVTGGDPEGTGFEGLGLPVHYALPESVDTRHPCLVVMPFDLGRLPVVLRKPATGLVHHPSDLDFPRGTRPILFREVSVPFWGRNHPDGHGVVAELRDSALVFHADVLFATFFMLSRWEETFDTPRDPHGRFPATASLAARRGFLDRPIVDEYALVLRSWLTALLPGWSPRTGRFRVILSHDIDTVRSILGWRDGVRRLGFETLKNRSPSGFRQLLAEVWHQALHPGRTPHFLGIQRLADLSKQAGLHSQFNFMASRPGPLESDYRIESPLIRRSIRSLREQGFEIGFHPGYRACEDPVRMSSEKERFDRATSLESYGARMHLLRFSPRTWRQLDDLGIAFDSTLGYADRAGFRAGTCHPFRPFDLERDCELRLWEHPLIAMDATLRRYEKLESETAEERIRGLADRCRAVEGEFTLLWHNSSLDGVWEPWFHLYRRLLDRFSSLA